MDSLLRLLDQAVNFHMQGRLEAATQGYRRAVAIEPANAAALHLYGVLIAQNGTATAASQILLSRSLRVESQAPPVRAHLAGVLIRGGALTAALSHLRIALIGDPGSADAVEYMGAVCHGLAAYRDAVAWSLRAHAQRPERAEPLVNLGAALRDARRFVAAETCFTAAIARDAQSRAARMGLAVSLLVRGDLAAGFAAFEARWKRLATRQWTGEPLDGRRLLIHAEQGFGDAIQFVRYVPLAATRGGSVTLEVHPAQVRLFRDIAPNVGVVGRGDDPPAHDVQCPMMSLPVIFGTTLATIPATVPYLHPDPADCARWAHRLGNDGRLRVGLVWAGNPSHANDRNRSAPIAAFAPILAVSGVRFLSLQAANMSAPPPPRDVEEVMREAGDFADSAALVDNLDLVIAVDTAALHLAGALGRPAWGLIAYAPDWRWLIDRSDSPWYPSVELFRQSDPGNWSAVTEAVAERLRALVARKISPGTFAR